MLSTKVMTNFLPAISLLAGYRVFASICRGRDNGKPLPYPRRVTLESQRRCPVTFAIRKFVTGVILYQGTPNRKSRPHSSEDRAVVS